MRTVLISDTHGLHRKIQVPDGDLLIHAGDFTNMGEREGVLDFNSWLGELPHKHKVIIAGNHDVTFQRSPEKYEPLITNAVYLRDREIVIAGLKIYGSPWSPKFLSNSPWAFETLRSERAELWAKIPMDTDILITHGPPNRILDRTMGGDYAGDEFLTVRVGELTQLKIHVFGHIHEGYGFREKKTKFFNASVLDVMYRVCNAPFVVEL